MQNNQTQLLNIEDNKKNRDFNYDFSFWSHSEYNTNEEGLYIAQNEKYADQRKVYDLVGSQMLDNAWQGYHCCLLAYGQTGAGKSYSMVGYNPNRGIVPIICEEIFKRIEKSQYNNEEYEVSVSMLEIYNEKVQDLLIPINKRVSGGLRIRENNTIGFYVENLTKYPVKSYEQIEQKMEEGSKHRTIASTQMNASSSRAHTIITVEFRKRQEIDGRKTEKFSMINLVDLAGSEKVGKTGAQGDRLKEAGQINKSLHILGLVISTLAEIESGNNKIKVPYRDSCLTKILCNALGGNSKTLMICAISPSFDNYQETLSTLRYADQAKKIKNKAVVNESAVDKLIRQLKQENMILKTTIQELRNKMNNNPNSSYKEVEDLEDQLKAMDDLMNDMQKTHQERLFQYEQDDNKEQKENIDLQNTVHLTNLNEDPILNNKIIYSLDKEYTYVGRKNAIPLPDIVLGSMGIKEKHAIFQKINNEIYLKPYNGNCQDYIHVNGNKVGEKIRLFNNDRIIFGTNSTFLIIIPGEQDRNNGKIIPKDIDWEFAQDEISKNIELNNNQEQQQYEKDIKEQLSNKFKDIETKLNSEKQENQDKIDFQKQLYEIKINQLSDKLREESQKQKLEKEKHEAEQQMKEIISKLEAERIQKQLEREKEKKKLQDEEQLRVYKLKQKEIIQQRLRKALPKIQEVGFIAKELKREIQFSTKIIYNYTEPGEIELQEQRLKKNIQILVKNIEEGTEYVWDLEKFSNRYYIIKGLLDRYFESNKIVKLQKNEDPFWDPPESLMIGQSFLKLMGLSYALDSRSNLNLIGDNGQCGNLSVGLIPCSIDGSINYENDNYNDDLQIEDPNDLLNKRMDFKVIITEAQITENLYQNIYVEYYLMNSKGIINKFKTKIIEERYIY
ncbi:kinesin motor domain protein [Ichthyophthirius multifiliis]|uniref:Kinesin-like protein n=1 Tax=Ichthyophthirius multifiliis TaxID=5932 RepID=G0R504_ICHMU|nr:kinesin motor domain protein [Ichthyophthirius multifiliis]EGR27406.1 kinesin motor domain protein [Ichthyophthirius multifiliis]|eukprot:XP_004024316.1 kinesin motor domain protein [Ichthyophthirius multifiliis]